MLQPRSQQMSDCFLHGFGNDCEDADDHLKPLHGDSPIAPGPEQADAATARSSKYPEAPMPAFW